MQHIYDSRKEVIKSLCTRLPQVTLLEHVFDLCELTNLDNELLVLRVRRLLLAYKLQDGSLAGFHNA